MCGSKRLKAVLKHTQSKRWRDVASTVADYLKALLRVKFIKKEAGLPRPLVCYRLRATENYLRNR